MFPEVDPLLGPEMRSTGEVLGLSRFYGEAFMKAQEARGAQFNKGGPVKRIKSMSTVVIPLFQNSIDRAANLGQAMDARCYTGGKDRTKLKPLSYDFRDVVAYLILVGIMVLGVWLIFKY